MQANQADLPIRAMAKSLRVSASGYYDWLDRAPSARQVANAALTERIRQIHHMSDATYGMPRVCAELRDSGQIVNEKRVARLMRQASLRGISRRRGYCITTQRDRSARPAPDLVKRQFVA